MAIDQVRCYDLRDTVSVAASFHGSNAPCFVFGLFRRQVQDQLKHLFDVDPPFIKRNIEDLINKDYLHRLEGLEPPKQGYKYVA